MAQPIINSIFAALLSISALLGGMRTSQPAYVSMIDISQVPVLNLNFDAGLSDALGNTATCSGSCPTRTAAGHNGTAAYVFDGASNFLQIASNSNLSLTDNFTLSIWIKTNSNTATDEYQGILMKGDGDNSRSWSLYLKNSGLEVSWLNGSWKFFDAPGANIQSGQWYHLVFTKSGTSQALYVNGTSVPASGDTSTMLANTAPLYIGGHNLLSDERFNGTIDDLQIYSKAFSASEVAELYRSQNGLVAPGCYPSSLTWQNISIPTQAGTFAATFDAMPKGANIDALMGFSNQAGTNYNSFATMVRFNDQGLIDVRKGSDYAYDVSVPYQADKIYHFRLSVNVPNHTYSVYVTPEGQSEIALATNYSFRNGQTSITSIANWGTYSDIGMVVICNVSVTGGVTPPTYTLNTSASNGSISKTPDQSSYNSGSQVVLAAAANSGYQFSGWSGDLSGGTNPATLTMNSNKSVTASFSPVAPSQYTITTSATNGTITKSPNQASYPSGTQVTLTATANSGYQFSGWSGDLSGSSNPVVLAMNGNKSVTASFTPTSPTSYTLTTSATNGSIAKSPNQASYPAGTQVVLTATANSGYQFSNWSGALSGGTNPAVLTMDSNKSVTANFTQVPSTALTPIARWDVVPYQRLNANGTLNVGVVAFSKYGIRKVRFIVNPPAGGTYAGQSTVDVYQMALNPDTQVWEYWTTIKANDFSKDGQISIDAEVYGNDGGIRTKSVPNSGSGLDALVLNVNPKGTLPAPEIWVSPTGGSDSWGASAIGDSTKQFATIKAAVDAIRAWRSSKGYGNSADGGIVHLMPGTHTRNSSLDTDSIVAPTEWVTVTTAAGGTRQNTIVTGSANIKNIGKLHLKGVTIHRTGGTLVGADAALQAYTWIDDNEVIGLGRWPFVPGGYEEQQNPIEITPNQFWTNDFIHDVNYPTTSGEPLITRGVSIENIAQDAFRGHLVVNSSLKGIFGQEAGPHADVFGGPACADNDIAYNVRATQVHRQGIYMNDCKTSGSGRAFVNVFVNVEDPIVDPGDWSAWAGNTDHLLIWHVTSVSNLADRGPFPHIFHLKCNYISDTAMTNVSVVGSLFDELSIQGSPCPLGGERTFPFSVDKTNWGYNHFSAGSVYGSNLSQGNPQLDAYGIPQNPTLQSRVPQVVPADADGKPRGALATVGAYEYGSGAPVIRYNLTSSAGTGGVVVPSGTNTYVSGSQVTIAATPNAGYTFSGWSGDLSGNTNPAILTIDKDKSVSASFSQIVIPPNCTLSSTAWQNTAIASQASSFTVTFDATPTATNVDALIGLSGQPAAAYSDLAASVRFNSDGYIDVRNGSTYTADTSAIYQSNVAYHFRFVVDVTKHVYSVFVTPPGQPEVALATNYAFRTEQASVASLGNWSAYSDVGSTLVCAFTVVPPNQTTYSISALAIGFGTISPTGKSVVNKGTSLTYTFAPNSGYRVSRLVVDNVTVGPMASYTFANVTADHTIAVVFEPIPITQYTITASAGTGGVITPSGVLTVNQGTSQTFTIVPTVGYKVKSVTVDGSGIGAVTSYTFQNIVADHLISAAFELIPPADTTPPIKITDLQAGETTPNSVRVTWSAPSDNVGVVAYEIRYMVGQVAADQLTKGSLADSAPKPGDPGQTQTYTLIGLSPSQRYTLGIRSSDLAGNLSEMASVEFRTATPKLPGGGGRGGSGKVADTIAPAFPSNFQAAVNDQAVTLSWENPKDLDFVRTIVVKDTQPIDSTKPFKKLATTAILYEGYAQTFTDKNVAFDQNYYYAAYSYDISSNYSKPTQLSVKTKGNYTVKSQNLPQVGTVLGASTGFFSPLTSLFSLGMRSEQVKVLQQMLAKEGLYLVPTSGVYDQNTVTAVQKFQVKYGLLTSGSPNSNGFGLSGPKTRAKLNELYAAPTAGANSAKIKELQDLLQRLIVMLAALQGR